MLTQLGVKAARFGSELFRGRIPPRKTFDVTFAAGRSRITFNAPLAKAPFGTQLRYPHAHAAAVAVVSNVSSIPDSFSTLMTMFPWLVFVIELPTFAVLAWLFARKQSVRYAWPVLAGALCMALAATAWGYQAADHSQGSMWPQVLAALAGYGAFLAALFLGWLLPRLSAFR